MRKIELEIVALSHSITQTHSYAVVLGEVNGLRRLPIVIGGFEAQAIAAERKENDLMPVAPKNAPRRNQVVSTNSIPVSALPTAPANDEDGDPVPAAAKTGWSIQVGAFPNAKAAKERLNDAKESATALLAKVTPYTEKVSKDSTNLFRARFAGFKSEWHAKRTCQTLLRHNFDCLVAKN